ncbi:MAG: tRNA (guanosine(37)-N1)-methyltransferase TrmD [Clostridiales Family XIII bacterium]|jgi:tRNA (guanine37-N1)-methyltransferase|nr:tRNA (guanosine(37)-N1)-methyltransferase TrmD [Clostridiales Family XIII bacterium]
MKIDILTIFPGMFENIMSAGVIGRAADSGVIDVNVHDIRSYSEDKHRRTDDEPFGGGAGMVMTVQPIAAAMDAIGAARADRADGERFIYLSPRGRLLDQTLARELGSEDRLVLLCGRYEGVDERVLDAFGFEEVSVGDYILTGGELPAMVLIDAVCRLMPGTLGSDESHEVESVYSDLLEYPQYTRPAEAVIDGETLTVPDILTSGHHRNIELWQYRRSLELTKARRPDLFDAYLRKYGDGGACSSALDREKKAILASVTGADIP